MTDWWDDGAGQIAFGRGARGFVVLNDSPTPLHRTFTTHLAPGAYYDVYQGAPVVVGAAGDADITVAPLGAIVLQKDQR